MKYYTDEEIKELHRGQLWPHGSFNVDKGERVARSFREYLCDLFTRGKHWFIGDNGGHTYIGYDGPVMKRHCKLCGNTIRWGH